jgi:cobalt-precorrin-5B (C1)-methyltransferase
VLTPGNLGQRFARSALQLPLKRVVQMANFIGFALDCVDRILKENGHRLLQLWVIGHPGKLAKILDDAWDTHSQQSGSAVAAIHRVASEFAFANGLIRRIEQSRTVEAIIGLLDAESFAAQFWSDVEQRLSAKISARLTRAERVAVRLFQIDGKALGGIK